MKKMLICLLLLFCLVGCKPNKLDNEVSIIVPNGIPYLAVAGIKEEINIKMDTVSGAENLQAALLGNNYDIVIAPINLGAKLYGASKSSYKLVAPITYNNAYIVGRSHLNLESLNDLSAKSVIAFGQTGIPGSILTKIYHDNNDILDINDVDFSLNSSANVYASFLCEDNKNKYALMSEPEISKLKLINNIDTETLDLCSILDINIAQAAIFVNPNSNKEDIDIVLEKIKINIRYLNESPIMYVDKVLKLDEQFFSSIGKDIMINMIPNANIKYGIESRKTDCEVMVNLLGIKGVNDEFYY